MSYYHYTKGCHLGSIVKEGVIRTTDAGIEKNEKPAAWLTKSPVWESECNVGNVSCKQTLIDGQIYRADEVKMTSTSNKYMQKEVGMGRILISEELPTITWAKFKHVSGISERMYNSLDRTCRRNGSPVEKWLCTFRAIPKKYWEGIEMYVDDRWIRWDEKMPIQEFVNHCLNCNGKINEGNLVSASTAIHVRIQLDFIENHYKEIVEFWEINKYKNGNVVVLVPSNYSSYECGFMDTDKPIQKSAFKILWKSETENYAYVQFDWRATSTRCYLALAY